MIRLLIIVPTLNSYKILPKLTKSLESQTYKNWQTIFIDGNSKREHRYWIESYCRGNKHFSWIEQNDNNHGIYGAMNQGFSLAGKNDWLFFWGSDDWIDSPIVFEELTKKINLFISKEGEPHLVICKGIYFNKSTMILKVTILIIFMCKVF